MTKDGTNVSAYLIGYLIGSVNNYHLNCACPSYKVIILLQKMWMKLPELYGLFSCFLFGASTFWTPFTSTVQTLKQLKS